MVPVIAVAVGCRPGNPGTPGALGLPAENRARLLSRSLTRTADTLHWKWSLIGERNWMIPANADGAISLEKTVPLNDPNMKGGCHIWESDLIVKREGDRIVWKTRLHGSNGMTREAEGALKGDLNDVRIVAERDANVGLPADVALAKVGDREIRWRLAR
ncbi:MAG: hypothetical protein SFU56_02435 [Capsulimonadales bacterium]|nr:hypothetical protein [Capsulimonadales bacterium]